MTKILIAARRHQALLLLCLISLAVLPTLILYPFHSDIDIQQVMGFQLCRFHGLPYLGSWDSNFPGTIWLHATAIALFGNSEIGLRLFDLVVQIGVIIALYRVSRLWIARGPALLGALLYALFYVNGPGQYISQRDCFAILPLILGAGLAVKARRSEWRTGALLAGVCFALAFWIRPTYALLAVVPCVTLFDLRTSVGRRLCYFEAFGFAIIVVLGLLPYLLTPHGLSEIYLATIRYNYEIYSHIYTFRDYSRRVWVAVAVIAVWAGAIILHARTGREFENKPRSNPERNFVIGSMIALLLGVAIMKRLASYHFAPFFAFFLPVLATVLWEGLQSRTLASRRWKQVPRYGVVVIAIAALYPWNLVVTSFSSHSICDYRFDRNYNASQAGAVATYIEDRTAADDPVEVASFFPTVRWRIDRPFVTRFTTPQPLFTMRPEGTPTEYQLGWRKEYVAQIERVRPKFYVIENYSVDSRRDLSTLSLFMTLEGFPDLLDRCYRLDTVIGKYQIYVRK